MFKKIFIVAAWASFALLVYGTLMHVELVYSIYDKLAPLLMRPGIGAYARLEHVVVFAVFGFIFAVAYPKRADSDEVARV